MFVYGSATHSMSASINSKTNTRPDRAGHQLRVVGHRGIRELRHGEGHHQPVQGDECLPRCRPDWSRPGHHAGQFGSRRGHHRNGFRAGAPVACDPSGLARRDRHHRGDSLRGFLAHGRAGHGRENPGIRRPHRRPADPAAIPEQRDRAGAKMGQGVRQFADYQAFTPIIESVRGLLAGTLSGGDAAAALAWCAGIALVGYPWASAHSRGARDLPGDSPPRTVITYETRGEPSCLHTTRQGPSPDVKVASKTRVDFAAGLNRPRES